MVGFHYNLGASTFVFAELWGLVLSSRIARDFDITGTLVEMDSEVVVNIIKRRASHCLFIKPLLDEVVYLLSFCNGRFSIDHIFREANRCVDCLANPGTLGPFLALFWLLPLLFF